MSLATRCSACGTAFRVVQDQLKVSEGWVRCGHCGEVFDALEGLFDLERGASSHGDTASAQAGGPEPSPQQRADPVEDHGAGDARPAAAASGAGMPEREHGEPDAARLATDARAASASTTAEGEPGPSGAVAAPLFVDPGPAGSGPTPAPDTGETSALDMPADAAASPSQDSIDAHWFGGRRAERRRAPAAQAWDRDQPDFSDARYDSDLVAYAGEGDPVTARAAGEIAATPLESAAHPEFLRHAERRARWEQPRARWALIGLSVLALTTLGLQMAHHFRSEIAARWPDTRPSFQAWCGLAACTLDVPQRIDQISVESTALVRAPGQDAFRLAVTLRNRASTALATPWLDLTLTDEGGRLVARRALAPQDLSPANLSLEPGAESVLQGLLATTDARVSGYTVEIFYP